MIIYDPPIKAVTFDVGYTVLFPASDVGKMYQAVLSRHGIEAEAGILKEQFFRHWKSYVSNKDGLIYGTTHEEALTFWGAILQDMLNSVCPGHSLPVERLSRSLYDEFSGADAWRLNPDWPFVLAHCRARGLKVGFLSNWDLRLGPLLADMKLSEQVDFQIISAEHGLEKPSSAIFECAALEAGVEVSELLHIGDTWNDDIVGATNAGCQAIWFNNGDSTPPLPARPNVHVIHRLIELTSGQLSGLLNNS